MLAWQDLDLRSDPDEAWCSDDPQLMVDQALELLRDRPAWHSSAACRGQSDLFFIERGQDVRPAKAICSGCPVAAECASAGMHERNGIWAGMSERQRRVARRSAA